MAVQDQSQLVSGRVVRLSTANIGSAPTDDSTEPHVTLSPYAGPQIPTTGFLFGMKAPTAPTGVTAAVAGAGGFTVTLWVRNPATKAWFSARNVSIAYGEAWVCWGVDAAELFFQVGNVSTPGQIDFHVAEQ